MFYFIFLLNTILVKTLNFYILQKLKIIYTYIYMYTYV